MNILYINHYAGSIYHGMEYRPYFLAREWVKLGHNVTILASSYSHIRQKNIVIPEGKNYLKENIDGINYIWFKTPKYKGNGIKRLINIFVFLWQIKSLRYDADLIIASSTYPFDVKVAYKIAKQNNAKLVYEVHDLWPLTLIEINGMPKWHPFILLMQKAEDFAYKHADKVVSLLPKAKEYMVHHGMMPNKFIYIPNGIDIKQIKEPLPNEHQKIINKLREAKDFLIGYAGGIGEANALDYLLTAAKILDKNVAFILMGEGINKEKLLKRLNDEKINNVIFLSAVSKQQVATFLEQMDALYIGWKNLPIYRFGICPNKIFDYMLSKKPIIHSNSLANDLVKEANCGISVLAEDSNAIANAIKEMMFMQKDELAELGKNAYNYVIKYHDYSILANNFLEECFL
ncbi:MAG TPA: glycosyltransferase family 4 protein [Burkholderiales bacterium]|nr:glycosyltransferase family 4 protein [Burkholderiales bacterium]